MKRSLVILFLAVIPSYAQQAPAPQQDSEAEEIARRSAAAGYYEAPDLKLRQERNYANTPTDVEPYGGVKPYK